jgi:lipid A 3-O-deacylase
MRLAWWGWLFVPGLAAAQSREAEREPAKPAGPEIALGVLEHGANFHPLGGRLFFPRYPAGVIVEGAEEDGTVDIQLVARTAPVPIGWLLRPRLAGKLQVSTAGRTSFASLGAEWRQHVLGGRVYGQIGIGVSVIDGYRVTPDPFASGLAMEEALRRYDIYRRRTSFGSRVLFNPNASIGVRLDPRWAVELVWEHFSHRQVFSDVNPGLDSVGIRLVRRLGR